VNKKKQKNFDSLKHLALIVANPAGIKSFLLLFFKKEALSCVSKQFLRDTHAPSWNGATERLFAQRVPDLHPWSGWRRAGGEIARPVLQDG
jgi:hypothetical protein